VDFNTIFYHLVMAAIDRLDFPSQCFELFYDFFTVRSASAPRFVKNILEMNLISAYN
jgi:hypothetical protein